MSRPMRYGVVVSAHCTHENPGQGYWLKVPVGKLDSERMVPLDEEVFTLVDRIAATRSPGRPMIHPRTGAPADFLFIHHGNGSRRTRYGKN